MERKKVTVAIPSNRGIRAKTVQSLGDLLAHGGYDFHVLIASEGYTIAENRNYIAVQALKNGSEYLLMVDDDMVFKPDLLDRMIEADKDILGVAYQPRTDDVPAMKWLDETHSVVLDDKMDDPEWQKVRECHATGTGIILIKTDVFNRIPRPWFMFEYYETGQVKLGEDWYFCEKAKKHGIKTHFDPMVYVGHLGEKEYKRKMFE